jgi:steroid delta-isomerase-like uncharacterized protein
MSPLTFLSSLRGNTFLEIRSKKTVTTREEQSKDFMRRFLEASVSKDSAAFKELMAADFLAHVPGGPKDREGFVQHMNSYNQAFGDMQVTVLDLITDGENVVARTNWRGTHTGAYLGLPPTGKQIDIEAYIYERVKDGKAVEHRSLFDVMAMMQQLGLVPSQQASR